MQTGTKMAPLELSENDMQVVKDAKRTLALKSNIRDRVLSYICPSCDGIVTYKSVDFFIRKVESNTSCMKCLRVEVRDRKKAVRLDNLLKHQVFK